MKSISIAALLLAVVCTSGIVLAQGMPAPSPELKKLDYFTGTWVLEGDIKASPMGPGGKMMETEKCSWMDGKYFLVCSVDFKSAAMGNGSGMSYLGYNSDEKVFTYDAFNSMGEAEHSKGTLDGDTWTWSNDVKMGGQTQKGRFIMKIASPTSYTFKYEMSPDGTTWNTGVEGKATKK